MSLQLSDDPPSLLRLQNLWYACRSWIEEQKPLAPESIYQMDHINEAAPELAERVCGIVGYFPLQEDE
jgi:hypothetical protein